MDRIATAADAAAATNAAKERLNSTGTTRPREPCNSHRVCASIASPYRRGTAQDPLVAPPPDTVVVVSLWRAAAPERQEGGREAALRAERHASEAAGLAEALRGQREAHAAEIERLRAGHAAELLRLAEARWLAQDAPWTGTERRPGDLGNGFDPGFQARSPARPPDTLRWLARMTGRV